MGAAAAALKNEQRSYDMLAALFGEEDARVQESKHWLRYACQKSP